MAHTEHKPMNNGRGPADGTDINIAAVVGFLGFLVVSFVIVNAFLYGMYRGMDTFDEKSHPMAQHQDSQIAKPMGITQAEDSKQVIQRIQNTYSLKDGPRLQVDDERDLNEMLREEKPRLEEYNWVNKEQHVVQIPVEHAMVLLVQRGLPYVPAAKPTAPVPAVPPAAKAK
jgi:hypothetical protein